MFIQPIVFFLKLLGIGTIVELAIRCLAIILPRINVLGKKRMISSLP